MMTQRKEVAQLLDSVTLALAAFLARKGELKQAESLLSPFVKKLEPGIETLDLQAKIYAQQGRIEEAQALWMAALEREPSNTHFLKALQTCAGVQSKGSGGPLWKNMVVFIIVFNIVLMIAIAVIVAMGLMTK
jgi:tetratricopeptide (TPR) repeat protein